MSETFYDDEIKGKVYDKVLLKRLLRYVRPYQKLVFASVFLIMVASGLELLWPQFIRLSVDKYVMNEQLGPDQKFAGVIFYSLMYLLTLIFSVILQYSQIMIMNYMGQKVLHDLRMDLFRHVEYLSVNFFSRNPVGRLVTRLTNDVSQLNELFTTGIVGMFGDIIMLCGIVVLMTWMHPKLTLISFTVLPLIFLSVVMFRTYIRPVYLEIRRNLARVNAFLQEHLTGIQIVQAFTQEQRSFDKFDTLNRDHREARLKMIKIHAIFMPVVDAFSNLAISVLLFFGTLYIYNGDMEIGMLIAFLLYCRRFYRPVMDLSQKYNILQDAMTSSARIFDLMDTRDSIKGPADTSIVIPRFNDIIHFRDVWFAYNPGEWVLKGIDLSIRKHEKVALVGLTGEGKTTIVNLLARFYEYEKGSITLDGHELKDLPVQVVRKQLAYVHQDVFLFAGTILDNIRLWDRTITEETAIEAARIVNLTYYTDKMPAQLHERVIEGGRNLSTGQKQLISFARALAFKPALLVLDEATSNIDSETEEIIQDALDKLLARQTSIIIAHRLSTIKRVDRILVVHKGRIAEQGTHQKLLRDGELYAKLYKLQFGTNHSNGR